MPRSTRTRFVPASRRRSLRVQSEQPASTLNRAASATLELLEGRRLLCALPHDASTPHELRPDLVEVTRRQVARGTCVAAASGSEVNADIVCLNRGQTTDGFSATFGANAETARRVMDEVIASFERMIGDFNYADGTENFNLTVNMSGNHNGASASLGQVLGGKPKTGTITMGKGGNGLGSGWFIDPTPAESSEFQGNIVNAFSGDAQAGSPASGLGDFLTVAAAEITHVLGLYGNSLSLWSSKTTNTGIADTSEGNGIGTFYAFRGPSIKHLLTSNNAGSQNWGSAIHAAGPGVNVPFQGDTYVGSQDIGNAIYEFGRRYVPNLAFSLMFKDAFGYSTQNPAQFGTFYQFRNPTTNQLTVRGGTGASGDRITISLDGSTLSVGVDPIADVPGTGALAGAGDLPAFVTTYDVSQVSSIVVNAGDGNDTITINGVPAGLTVTVNGDGGNDTVNFSNVPAGAIVNAFGGFGNDTFSLGGGNLLANVLGDISMDGGSGTDTVSFDDSTDDGDDGYTIGLNGFTKTGSNVFGFTGTEAVGLKANPFNNTIQVLASLSTRPITVEAGDGDDTVNVGGGRLTNLPALVTIDGQGGNDTVTLDDSTSPTGEIYNVGTSTVNRAGFGGLAFSNAETLRLLADTGNSIVVVDDAPAGVNLIVNGGEGDDTLTINETSSGSPVGVESSAGSDTVNVNVNGLGTAAVRFVSDVTRLATLNMGAAGAAALPAGGTRVLVVTNLIVNPSAQLDLADNAMVVDYAAGSTINTVKNLLASGYASGAWNGNGINSSVAAADTTRKQALGYAEATDLFSAFPATFAGVEVDNTAVLVRHTIYGDVNLDRQVNLADFNRLAANFGTGTTWNQGNLNYDAVVNLADFNILASNFGTSLPAAGAASTALIAPPTTGGSRGVPSVDTGARKRKG